MLNALEKVMYPNGTTRALGDVMSGSVSSIIDEVHANTSAITSITAQLSALVDDVGTNTSAITTINNKLLTINAGIANLDLNREVNHHYDGVDLTEFFADEISQFSDEWAWINNRVQTGNFLGLHVGDYIPVITTETTPVTYHAVIMGINTYKGYGDADHVVGNHIDWCFDEVWATAHAYNKVGYNNGLSSETNPFLASDLNYFINSKSGSVPNGTTVNPSTTSVDYTAGGVLHYLPAKLKAVITKKRINCPERYSNDSLLTNDNSTKWADFDDLWILSEYEVMGTAVYGGSTNDVVGQIQYPLFASNCKKAKQTPSGTRVGYSIIDATRDNSNGFAGIAETGVVTAGSASGSWRYVCPCFRTGGVTLTTRKKTSKKKGD